MTNDTMKVFDSFLREWCEQRGWPYQPMSETASEYLRDADTRLRDHVRDAQEYWASVDGTDEHEMREFNRECEEEGMKGIGTIPKNILHGNCEKCGIPATLRLQAGIGLIKFNNYLCTNCFTKATYAQSQEKN